MVISTRILNQEFKMETLNLLSFVVETILSQNRIFYRQRYFAFAVQPKWRNQNSLVSCIYGNWWRSLVPLFCYRFRKSLLRWVMPYSSETKIIDANNVPFEQDKPWQLFGVLLTFITPTTYMFKLQSMVFLPWALGGRSTSSVVGEKLVGRALRIWDRKYQAM